ncbi:MAG: DUF4189 domain-containing protein [Arenimonas sp.]
MRIKLLFILSLLVISNSASTEGGTCPDGYYPQTGGGVSACLPIPGYDDAQPQQPQQPQIRWATRWGAIAIASKSASGGSSVVGASTSQVSKSKAQKAAIAECRNKGGAKCVVKLAYYNQCAAIVWGDAGYNLVNESTLEKASSTAMQSCNNADKNCQVYYAACSLPERLN